MKKTTIIIILLCALVVSTTAKERTTAEKKQLAAQALTQISKGTNLTRSIASADELTELRTLSACTLVGYADGAFAVVSNDDAQTAVVGVATTATKGDNPNFEWWLQAINEVLADEASKGIGNRRAPGPDIKKYPPSVAPLVSSHWGQGDPYYRQCPTHPQDVFCATGCVATAMAQILYSHRQPTHGFGIRTIYYPYRDETGQAVTADFSGTTYDWDNMIDSYNTGEFTDEQANAVATLMLHCAVAADMQFGGYNHGGSGTTQSVAAEGLRYYFGFENARPLMRSNYSDEDWMDMVYGELSQGNAILYGGQNLYGNGGHAFVIHGYREDGFVYVNWGWNGDAEGYFDIDKLNPNNYRFSESQDMVIGISGPKADLQSFDIQLSTAGELSSKLSNDALQVCGTLKLSGQINSTDLKTIRVLAGRDQEGSATEGNLSVLDLSEAEIVDGGEPYLTENGKQFTTTAGELPYKAFYDCRKLTVVKLPKNIRTVANGAFGGCYLLQEVEWASTDNSNYVVEGPAVYSTDRTQLITVLPTAMGTFSVPLGVTSINALAFAGCVGLSKVDLPASVVEIGGEAFRNCFSLIEIRLHSKVQPALAGYDTFEGVRKDLCKLMIPSSATMSDYTNKVQWRDFANNILMYGTTLTATNLDKDYGEENPRLGYKLKGDNVDGTPQLTTTATVYSLPGDYPIYISAGTVDAPDVEFVDGVLTIYPAVLTVKAVDVTRRPEEVEQPYQLQFTGFVNGEDEHILQELPTVTTEAVNGSPEGTYTLRVSGGQSDRYEFKYRTGILTIDANAPSGIAEIQSDVQQSPIYTLDGRRIKRATQKGIYVTQGKKIVISK